MNANEIIYTTLIIFAILFTVGWIFKKYFNVNNRQLKTKSSKYFIDLNNLNAANGKTITESNNFLSTRPFDGVNRNPECEESCALTHKIKNRRITSHIKHMAFLNNTHI